MKTSVPVLNEIEIDVDFVSIRSKLQPWFTAFLQLQQQAEKLTIPQVYVNVITRAEYLDVTCESPWSLDLFYAKDCCGATDLNEKYGMYYVPGVDQLSVNSLFQIDLWFTFYESDAIIIRFDFQNHDQVLISYSQLEWLKAEENGFSGWINYLLESVLPPRSPNEKKPIQVFEKDAWNQSYRAIISLINKSFSVEIPNLQD